MILDAQTLLAYFDARAALHWSVSGEIELLPETEKLIVSPFVIAQLEPMIRREFGLEGWLATLEELAGGAWTIAAIDRSHLAAVRQMSAVAGSTIAEASVVVLAAS